MCQGWEPRFQNVLEHYSTQWESPMTLTVLIFFLGKSFLGDSQSFPSS